MKLIWMKWKGVFWAAVAVAALLISRSFVRPAKTSPIGKEMIKALTAARDARDKAKKEVIWHEAQQAISGLGGLSDDEFDDAVLSEYRRRKDAGE